MVVFTRDDKDLSIPSSLGNFNNAGGGSGSGMTPEEVQGMIDTSIEEYDTEIQVDLEDIRENVSGNTEDIATISGTTGALGEMVASLSGTTSSLASSVDSLAGAVTGLTEGFENLSGATAGISGNLNALSGAVETLSESLSGYTTTDTFNQAISGVSADVEEVSGKTQEVYDAIFYEDEGETYSQIDDLWDAVDGKQDALSFQSGLTEEEGVVRITPPGRGISLSEGGRLQLNMGSGVTIGDNNELNVKIGEGLGFSGDTLVVSGISGGGSDYVIVDDLEDIEEPYEGLIAYVRSTSSLTEYSYFYFPNPNDYPTEGYVGYIKRNEGEDMAVYVSENYFYWDWENDGDWHTRDFYGTKIKYRCVRDENDASNSQFWVIFPEGSGLYLEPSQAEVATGTSGITVWNYSQPVVYNNGVWVPVGGKVYNFGNIEPEYIFATSAETIAFMDEVMSSAERDVFPQIYLKGHMFTYSKDNSPWVNFKSMFDYNQSWNIYFSDTVFDDNGFNSAGIRVDRNNIVNDPDLSMAFGGVDSGGTNSSNLQDYLGDDYQREHYLYRYALRTWNPENPDEIWGLGLVKWWYRYKVEWDNDEGWRWYYVIAADVPVETTIYSGVWGWIDNEHIETLEWTSGATYESQTYTKYVPQ